MDDRVENDPPLAATEQRYAAVFDRSVDAILLVDDRGRVLDANPAAVSLVGKARRELTASTVFDLVADDLAEDGLRKRWAGLPAQGSLRGELPLRRASGEVVATDYVACASILPGLHMLVVHDVSDRLRIERELAEMNERLRQLDAYRSGLISMVSHDIRSPLGVITGALGELTQGRELDAEQQMLVRLIKRSSARLVRLATNLLDVSRMEAGALELQKRRVDLARFLRELAEELRTSEQAGAKVIELEAPKTGLDAVVDPDRVGQIVSNLVSNALRHATHRVSISLHRQGDRVKIEVVDDGAGIPDDQLERIFDRFHSAGREGKHKIGLGLTIARGLVEAHGGDVRADNVRADGGVAGARFTVTLPLE